MSQRVFSYVLALCAVLLCGCRERPQDARTRQEQRRERHASRITASGLHVAQRIAYQNQTALLLDVDYNGGFLDVVMDSNNALVDLDLTYDNEALRPEITYDSSGSKPYIKIRTPRDRRENLSLDDLRANRWRLKVSPRVALECEIEAGAVDAWLNFSGLQLQDLKVSVGAGEMRLDFRERNTAKPNLRLNAGAAAVTASGLCNANFDTFKFNGGAGKSELSFDGDYQGEGRVELKFGVGLNTIRLAPELGVRIRKSGSFLAPISLHGFDKEGNYFISPNYERAAKRLDFEIQMGVGHTAIHWIADKN